MKDIIEFLKHEAIVYAKNGKAVVSIRNWHIILVMTVSLFLIPYAILK